MQYPQFREKLLHIATDKSKHAEWIAEKIATLAGKLPEVPERRSMDENSWQYLLTDLEEENRSADHPQSKYGVLNLIIPTLPQVCNESTKRKRSIAGKSGRC
jgi:hypothetical protein